ncbi:MAG: putative ATP-dependent RNA helicase [Candidatus Micrarchaeota archaeon]|nr:MAG: putative ATP-dependent RNA helicase [Candidatus Micrarchaeota archaeon]
MQQPFLRFKLNESIKLRDYQKDIISSILRSKSNSLVILPTGTGKTIIAIYVILAYANIGKKALFLAPTKPLAEQHYKTVLSITNLTDNQIALAIGSKSYDERATIYKNSYIVVATPQTIKNDLERGLIDLKDFSLIVFDEAHKAVGRYAYAILAEKALESNIRIIALTASPGGSKSKIISLLSLLNIGHIEIRSEQDKDIIDYIPTKLVKILQIALYRELQEIADKIAIVIDEHMQRLYERNLSAFRNFRTAPKSYILSMADSIRKIEDSTSRYISFLDYSYVLHLMHAHELLTVEGLDQFLSYIYDLRSKASKSRNIRAILNNSNLQEAVKEAELLKSNGYRHPKVDRVLDLLNTVLKDRKVIIFAQYKSTINVLNDYLRSNNIKVLPFMGKNKGMSQRLQEEFIERFRTEDYQVLVSTSIGEEGLDIPAVDAVIFYEAIPSEIRSIQRKGRAGRIKAGEIYILVTRDSRDEYNLRVVSLKERRMHELIYKIKNMLESGYDIKSIKRILLNGDRQRTLKDFMR